MGLETRAIICMSPKREFLYLDEVEREAVCRARGCRGAVRMAMQSNSATSGFVGGWLNGNQNQQWKSVRCWRTLLAVL